MLFEQLTRPFGYLSIKEVKGKGFYDWVLPIIFTLCTALLVELAGASYALLNEKVISGLVAFVSNLPGFYIAALAAVATFQSDKLEQNLDTRSSITPYIEYNIVNENRHITSKRFKLTRRAYLSYMFAFLTALSFIIVIFNKLSLLIPETLPTLLTIYCVILLFAFYQMVVTTFCGLYYLGSRLHE
ncbi:hypothetical protein BK412_21840 [Vibrio campbellii]|uniref:hypothetical protein n=1 Tax=Vibrio campbellii TaxID=680 RepID=UPI0009BF6FA7|nr:hypothetical protein [Vibrio campbellii]OQQ00557.1 hypothetical protein BK412_21840 [Vibrio campbellii]